MAKASRKYEEDLLGEQDVQKMERNMMKLMEKYEALSSGGKEDFKEKLPFLAAIFDSEYQFYFNWLQV